MSRWYVIVLSVLTVLAVLGIALAGVYLHHRYPHLLPWSIVAAVLVGLGSMKALLEVSKLATELEKAQLERRKLGLEVEELQDKKEKRDALIVPATTEEILRFNDQFSNMKRRVHIPGLLDELSRRFFSGFAKGLWQLIGPLWRLIDKLVSAFR